MRLSQVMNACIRGLEYTLLKSCIEGQRTHKLDSLANLAWIGQNQPSYLAGRFYGHQSRISWIQYFKNLMHPLSFPEDFVDHFQLCSKSFLNNVLQKLEFNRYPIFLWNDKEIWSWPQYYAGFLKSRSCFMELTKTPFPKSHPYFTQDSISEYLLMTAKTPHGIQSWWNLTIIEMVYYKSTVENGYFLWRKNTLKVLSHFSPCSGVSLWIL